MAFAAAAAVVFLGTSNLVSADPRLEPACPIPLQPLPSAPGVMPDVPRAQPLQRASECFVRAADVKQKQLRGGATLVDVRSPADFDRYRIPGSLNIPLHLLKTKSFLKRDFLILVNEGRATAELEAACRDLRKAGFRQLAVLKDGLIGWQAAQGEIAGDLFALSGLTRITADEMFAERDYGDWVVLDLTDGKRKDLFRWLPARVATVKPGAASKLPQAIRMALSKQQKHKEFRLVVVADSDADYERIESVVTNAGARGVLYLDGGLQGYRDYLNRQIAMWNQKDQPPKWPSCRG